MKRNNNLVLFILFIIFFAIFIFNFDVKMSIIDSISIWLTNLVPAMVPMYLITDLLLNYGLSYWSYTIFKNNNVVLVILSLLLGCPSNAKYIKEFYNDDYISEDNANYMLTFAYSPNPLFILSIAPTMSFAIKTIIFIYATNILNMFIFRKLKNKDYVCEKRFPVKTFTEVLETSIFRTFKILILILGIIIVYGIINTFISIVLPYDNLFLKSLLEMTNALSSMMYANNDKWFIFACTFGGLSIHTQIKSILEDTSIKYKYFLYGRLIASAISIIISIF